MTLGDAFHRRVVSQLAQQLSEAGKHALLIFAPANIRYVTGLALRPTDRPVAACVWASGEVALFVPYLELDHVDATWKGDLRWYAEPSAGESPVRWIAREAGAPLLVDAGDAGTYREIAEEVEDVELRDLVAALRAVKTPAEIELIERAADFADLALERTFARLTTGSPEWDVLADITSAVAATMRAEIPELIDPTEPPIRGVIRSGPQAAFPNAPATARRLARGDSVIVEFTVIVGGYHAVAGSTFFVGDPLRDVVSWVEAAISAQAAAREALRPGASAEAGDAAARRALERNGLGDNMRHRTGHGIGLSPREAPWLVKGAGDQLQVGMVLVNHPGVYIPGRTGARHAETLVIEEGGARVLNPRIARWANLEARLKEF